MEIKEIELPDIELDTLSQTEDLKNIVVFNDDVNTFEHVIVSLMDICEHNALQAEQCAMMVHYNGKCSVKRGTYNKLRAKCEALLDRGINAEIQ